MYSLSKSSFKNYDTFLSSEDSFQDRLQEKATHFRSFSEKYNDAIHLKQDTSSSDIPTSQGGGAGGKY